MYKKAQYAADTMPFYVIFAIVISILFFTFALFVNNQSTENVSIPEGLEDYLIYQRFLRSPNCFTYEDISGRIYPLTIDMEKFNKENIEKCYIGNDKTTAFRLTLDYQEITSTLNTNNWDFNDRLDRKETPISVMVYINDKKYPGKISIEVQDV